MWLVEDYVLFFGVICWDIVVVVYISVLIFNMEKDNCGYNKYEMFDDFMDFYKEVVLDYD